MKAFCPNCEKETDSSFICEVYFCKECGEDNGNYHKPAYRELNKIISDLIENSNNLADELRLEQNSGYECWQLSHHNQLIRSLINNPLLMKEKEDEN
jgi:hypothetical protein